MYAAAPKKLTIKQLVEQEFGRGSVMVRVAYCESRHRQFNKSGAVLRGEQNPQDVGIFQINEYWNLAESKKIGNNIYTIEGNIKHAKYMFERYGTKPWAWSQWCWG